MGGIQLDVLLIKPDFNDIAVMPPLGLGYLASMLIAHGISVKIHDNTLFRYDAQKLSRVIRDLNPSIIGISAVTPVINRSIEIAALTKKINKDIIIIIGGPHPTSTVEETLSFKEIDIIVTGEGEQTLTEIVTSIKNGNKDFSEIKGCAFKNRHNEIIISAQRQMIENLDSLPFPDFNNMPLDLYFRNGSTFGILQKQSKSLPIIASRGCPSKCIFCQRFLGEVFRIRSAENIVAELEYLRVKFGVSDFNFLDDNFTLDKKRVMAVCDLMHKKNLKIKFRFPNGVREDTLDMGVLSALKSAGCYHLDFGIESGSQRVLNLMKKGKRIENIAEKVYLCKRQGFKLSASFIFGTPGETLEDMEETIRFATSLPLDSASFAIVVPFPGTELHKDVVSKGYLVNSDYRYYNPEVGNFKTLLIKTPHWSGRDLVRIVRKANRSFFLRPGQILKLVPTMFKPINRRKYVSGLKSIFK